MSLPRWHYAPAVSWHPDVQQYFSAAFGPPKLARVSEALARPPLKQAVRVNTLRCPPGVSSLQLQDEVARQLQQELGLSELPQPHGVLSNTLVLQGKGPLDVDYAACEGRQVVINRYAGEAVLRGANVYCPGLLAASTGLAEGDLVGVSVAVELPGSNWCGIPRGTVLPRPTPSSSPSSSCSSSSSSCSSSSSSCSSDPTSSNGNASDWSSDHTSGHTYGHTSGHTSGPPFNCASTSVNGAAAVASTPASPSPPMTRKRRARSRSVAPLHTKSTLPQGSTAATAAAGVVAAAASGPTAGAAAGVSRATAAGVAVGMAGAAAAGTVSTVESETTGGTAATPASGQLAGTAAGISRAAEAGAAERTAGGTPATAAAGKTSAAALPSRDHLFLGVGRCVAGRRAMFRSQSGLAVQMAQRVFESQPLNGVLPGRIMLQALPSSTAAQVLSPEPGSRVLDMCAAPGGKTTLLAELMQDRGEVWALDRTHAKVQEIRNLAASFGITCIKAVKADATQAVRGWRHVSGGSETKRSAAVVAVVDEDEREEEEAGARSPKATKADDFEGFEPESFDYILLDPPCSALGLRPRLHHSWTLKQLLSMADYQRALMHAAVALLKPGGTLVYSTCTINPAENEGNVRFALDRWGAAAGTDGCQLQLLPATPLVGGPGLTGPWVACSGNMRVVEVRGKTGASGVTGATGAAVQGSETTSVPASALDTTLELGSASDTTSASLGVLGAGHDALRSHGWLTAQEAAMVQRFDPDDAQGNDSIGFFVAKFRKGASWRGGVGPSSDS